MRLPRCPLISQPAACTWLSPRCPGASACAPPFSKLLFLRFGLTYNLLVTAPPWTAGRDTICIWLKLQSYLSSVRVHPMAFATHGFTNASKTLSVSCPRCSASSRSSGIMFGGFAGDGGCHVDGACGFQPLSPQIGSLRTCARLPA